MWLERILVVDDEPSNVEALLNYFERCKIPHEYTSTLEEAAQMLKEARKPYGAIICDNHFCTGEIDGVDFCNIILGNEENYTREYEEFIDENFGRTHKRIVNTYQGRVIMFSGSAASDSQYNPLLFTGMKIAQKRPNKLCEQDVINALKELGYEFRENIESIREYKQKNGLQSGCKDENANHEAQVAEFLRSRGLSEEEIKEYSLD